MTALDTWAQKWGIPSEALLDLKLRMGMAGFDAYGVPIGQHEPQLESHQQQLVRLDAAKNGVWLTRNNVGALIDARGTPVRFGLCNESKRQNQTIKSGDLIGMRSILIETRHVGMVIAQFVSREVKKEGWTYRGNEHEVAQNNWMQFVLSKGGDAAFTTGPGSFNNWSV